MSEYILQLKGISKSFAGVKALKNVDFNLRPGEVHVLVGENGAGKSTLMKIIDGVYQPDGGNIMLKGKPAAISSPKEAINNGISMIHQELNAVVNMTISENIFLGRELKKRGFLDKRTMFKESQKALEKIGIQLDPNERMGQLTVSQMQMVEIAKAVSYEAKIVIMDEPTSAISDKEVQSLFKIIAWLKAEGVGIVYISHKMDEIFQLADTITVLRDGQTIVTEPASAFNQDSLIAQMVGRELNHIYPPPSERAAGEVVLEAEQLSNGANFHNVSFQLRRGEILGIAGLMGAGRSELLETIFGMRRATGGQLVVNGKRMLFHNPRQAISKGVALLTEDRRRTGLNLKASIKHDMSIVTLKKYCRWGQFISAKRENAAVEKGIVDLGVKCHSSNQMIVNLSGGNQQKVIISRWLMQNPQILMLDEPTRGIDVGAKYEIYSIIQQFAAQGRAVLVVSSELPEIIGLCDRVLVMKEGRLMGELNKEQMDQERIMALAVGLKEGTA